MLLLVPTVLANFAPPVVLSNVTKVKYHRINQARDFKKYRYIHNAIPEIWNLSFPMFRKGLLGVPQHLLKLLMQSPGYPFIVYYLSVNFFGLRRGNFVVFSIFAKVITRYGV